MKQTLNLSFQRGDLLAILLVSALALAVFAAFLPHSVAAENSVVQVYQDGVLIRELSLNEDARLDVSGDYTNTLVVSGGSAAIGASDCPGGDCIHSSRISGPGRSIVCLPNRVEIRIAGAADVDFAVG